MQRRSGSVQAFRRRNGQTACCTALCANRTREGLPGTIFAKPAQTRAEAKGQAPPPRFLGPRGSRPLERLFARSFCFPDGFAGQLGIGKALADDLADYVAKPICIVHRLPIVVAECLFINIAEKMKWFHADIGSSERAFQETPKILQTVGVNVLANIGFGVVDDLVCVFLVQPNVSHERIGENLGPFLHVVFDDLLYNRFGAFIDHVYPNSLAPFQNSMNDGLAASGGTSGSVDAHALPLGLVHIPSLPADEGFIHFHFAPKFAAVEFVLHSKPNPMEHEPRGFLGNADSAVDLPGGNAILSVGEKPNHWEPLVQAQGGILENGPNLDGELPLGMAGATLPALLISEKSNMAAPAGGAGDAIGPALRNEVANAAGWTSEIPYGFLKGSGVRNGCHIKSIPVADVLVKYIFTKTFIENKRVNQG